MSQERKDENVAFMKQWHENNPHSMKGKHHTEEAKAKMSQANKGQTLSEEHKKKLSDSLKMDQEKEAAVIKAYLDGKTFATITKELKVGRSGIYRVLKRNNIQLRDK